MNQFEILVQDLGKRYNREWIFRNFSTQLNSGEKLVITGLNGSGKSTLLLVLASHLSGNEGKIIYYENKKEVKAEKMLQFHSFTSPYLELIEEFTLREHLNHVQKFKPFLSGLDLKTIVELSGLEKSSDKPIKHFSSGMKQRLKLTSAILSNAPLLFLDEPATNLDHVSISWYKDLMNKFASQKTVVVGSNKMKDEYEFCTKEVNIHDYKKH